MIFHPSPHSSSHAPDPLHLQSTLVLVLKSGAPLCAVQRAQYAPDEGRGILGWWTKNSQYFPSLAHVLSHNDGCVALDLQTAVRAPTSHKPGQAAIINKVLPFASRCGLGKTSAHNLHLGAITATSRHLQHMLDNRIGASLETFSTTVSIDLTCRSNGCRHQARMRILDTLLLIVHNNVSTRSNAVYETCFAISVRHCLAQH